MKIIAYVNADGNISIVTPFESEVEPANTARRRVPVVPYEFVPSEADPSVYVPVTRPETDDEFVAWVAAKDVPGGVIYKISERPDTTDDEELVTWFEGLPASDTVGRGPELWQIEEANRLEAEIAAIRAAFEEIRSSLEGPSGDMA